MSMLLTIDLGNTCIKLGLFEDEKEVSFALEDTKQKDYKRLLKSFLKNNKTDVKDVEDVIISSVVPVVKKKLLKAIEEIFNKKAIEIDVTKNYGITVDIDNPLEIGEDLLVMCAYGYNLYKRDLIVCSLGTCSVFCSVFNPGSLRYAIIAPGFKKMAESLYTGAAQLSQFEMEKRDSLLASNTKDAMNVGFFSGYLGLVDYFVSGLKKELNKDMFVIGCGGDVRLVEPYTDIFDYSDTDFVTKGLNYIYHHYYE